MKLRTCLLVSVSLGFILCGCGGSVEEKTIETDMEQDASTQEGKDASPSPASLVCPQAPAGTTQEESMTNACGGECLKASCFHGPCLPEVLADTGLRIMAMAVDAGYLYFSCENDYVIRRSSLQTHEIDEVVTIQGYAHGLAVSGGRLYWTSAPVAWGFGEGDIGTMTLPSGPPVVMAKTDNARAIGVADGALVYSQFDSGIWRLPASDGSAKGAATLIAPMDQSAGVWISGDTVFWTAINAYNSVRTVSLLPGHAQGIVACSQQWPNAVTADDRRVYWFNRHVFEETGRLMAWERSEGGTPKVLVEGVGFPAMAITGNETTLFWADDYSRVIMRMEK